MDHDLDHPTLKPGDARLPARARRRASTLWGLAAAASVLIVALAPAAAQYENEIGVNVLVKDAASDQPINQAHLTLQFREPPGKTALSRRKMISFSAKTNAQGKCHFADIPKGTVRLIVTAEDHQTFSKEFEVTENNQELDVKLKKPQPLL